MNSAGVDQWRRSFWQREAVLGSNLLFTIFTPGYDAGRFSRRFAAALPPSYPRISPCTWLPGDSLITGRNIPLTKQDGRRLQPHARIQGLAARGKFFLPFRELL